MYIKEINNVCMFLKYLELTVFYSNHVIHYLLFMISEKSLYLYVEKVSQINSLLQFISNPVFLFNHSCTERFLLSTSKLGIFYFDSTAIIYTLTIRPSCGNLNIRSVLGLLLLLR